MMGLTTDTRIIENASLRCAEKASAKRSDAMSNFSGYEWKSEWGSAGSGV